MTVNRSRLCCHRLTLPACVLLLAACGSSGCSGGALSLDAFGRKYKLADNEVSGWTQSKGTDPFLLYTAETLTDKIDGAAIPYVKQGMQFAMYQVLDGPDPQTCNLTAMHFGTEAQAKLMLASQKTTMSASLTVPGYDASVASAAQALTGITVFAAFKDLYIETVLDGYGSDVNSPSQVGAKFLQAMRAKTTK
jgi:hypothetical protein